MTDKILHYLQDLEKQKQIKILLACEIDGGPIEATRVAALLLGRAFAFPGRSNV